MPFSIKHICSGPKDTTQKSRTYTEQASTEELHTDLNNMRYTELYSIQQMVLQL